jgi:phage-related protein
MAEYSGGRITLSIVPVFTGIQREIGRQAATWGAQAGLAFNTAFKRSVERADNPRLGPTDAESAKQGEDAGKAYGGGFRSGLGAGGPIPVPGPGKPASRKQGSESGDAYANAFRRQLEAATRALPRIELPMATTEAKQKVRDLRGDLERLSGQRVGIDIDEATANAEIERLKTELRDLGASSPDITVRTNTAVAISQLEAFQEEIRRLNGEKVEVKLDLDDGAFSTRIRDAVRRAQASLPKIEVDANTAPADVEIAQIRERLASLGEKRIGIDISTTEANAQIEGLLARLARLGAGSTDIRVQADVAAASAALAALNAEAEALDGKNVNLDVDTGDIRPRTAAIAALVVLIGSIAPALVPIGGIAVGALGALSTAAAGAVPAVASLLLAFNGVGDALKAMEKVDDDAGKSAEKNAAKRQQQAQAQASAARQIESAEASLANTRASAARAAEQAAQKVADAQARVVKAEADAVKASEDASARIADAQQKLQDARDEAARSAEQSQRRIADAERSLADAEAAAAKSAEQSQKRVADAREAAATAADRAARDLQSALRRQEDAERSLTKAQEDQLDAQEALTQAKKDAQEASEDLAFRVEKGSLDQRQAVLDLADAQKEYNDTLADPGASDDAKEQAKIRFQEAQLQLKQLQVDNARLAQEKAESDAKGVDGSDQVVAAEGRVADAAQARADAQRAADEAAQGVVDARVAGAKAIADANEAVAEAEASQADAAISSARSIADAQQGVADANAAAALSAEQSARRIGDAEKGVADAAKTAADTRLQGLQSIAEAQSAVTDAVAAQAEQQRQAAFSIEQAERSLQGAREASAQAAATGADAASTAVQNLQTAMDKLLPSQAAFATFLYRLGPEIAKLKAAAADNLLPGLTTAIEALLPIMPSLTTLIASAATTLGNLAVSAAQAFGGDEWQSFFAFLAGPGMATFDSLSRSLGSFITSFGQLLIGLQPATDAFNTLFGGWAQDFADFTSGLSSNTAFQDFVSYIVDMMPAASKALGDVFTAVGDVIGGLAPYGQAGLDALSGLSGLISALAPGLGSILGLLSKVVGALANALAPVVTALTPFITALADTLGGFLADALGQLAGPLATVATALGGALMVALTALQPVLPVIAETLGQVASILGVVLTAALTALAPVLGTLVGAFADITSAMYPLISQIDQAVLPLVLALIPIVAQLAAVLANVLAWTVTNVLVPALNALSELITKVVAPTIQFFVDVGTAIVNGLISVFKNPSIIWDGIKAAFFFIVDAVKDFLGIHSPSTVFAEIGDNIIAGLQGALKDGVAVIVKLWDDFWDDVKDLARKAWDWIGDLTVRAWGGVKDRFNDGIRLVKDVWDFFWKTSIIGALVTHWDDIGKFLVGAWHGVEDRFTWGVGWAKKIWDFFWETSIIGNLVTHWDDIGAFLVSAWHGVEDRFTWGAGWVKKIWEDFWNSDILTFASSVFDKLGNLVVSAMHGVEDRFKWGVDWIKAAWDAVQDVAKAPVKFFVDTVLNDGIIAAFNWVASKVGLTPDPYLADFVLPEGFARGGILPGTSSWRDGDDQLAPVRRGEGIAVSEAMAVPEARDQLLTWNRLALRGGPQAVQQFMRGGYAQGGIVGIPLPSGHGLEGFARGGTVDSLLALGHMIVSKFGVRVSDNKAWGDNPRPGAHSAKGWHYKLDNSGAIDVNLGYGNPAGEKAALDKVVGYANEQNFRTIWQADDHYDHAHIDLASSDSIGSKGTASGILDKIGDALSGAWDFLSGLNPIDYLKGKASEALSGLTGSGVMADVAKALPGKLLDTAGEKMTSLLSSVAGAFDAGKDGGGNADYSGGGVEQWRSTAQQALQVTGQPADWVGSLLRRMNQESGGNPTIVNKWDSNWKAGHPSVGLMQVIKGTYEKWIDKEYDQGPYSYGVSVNPLSNIIASIRYANGKYGSAPKGWDRKGGYALGGVVGAKPYLFDQGGVVPPGYSTIVNATRQPEALLNPQQWADIRSVAVDRSKQSRDVHFNGPVVQSTAAEVARELMKMQRQQEALAL